MALAMALAVAACGGDGQPSAEAGAGGQQHPKLSGSIVSDGSSTVQPLTEAIAEEFRKEHPNVNVSVATSGTGGGFTKFCSGQTDISNASRPIDEEEVQACQSGGVEYTEFRVGLDGLAVVTHKDTAFLDTLNYEQLRKIFGEGGATTWNQVDPSFPSERIAIFAPGIDSGTYDFFVEEVLGDPEAGGIKPRPTSEFTTSENDDTLVQGIAGTRNSWGFFGYAYYVQNQDKLKILKIAKEGSEGVEPTPETIASGDYPLSRPLFIYVKNESLRRPEVKAFVQFYLEQAPSLVEEVGYVKAPDEDYARGLETLRRFS